jgi:AhpD family alkylhydroperoxidase
MTSPEEFNAYRTRMNDRILGGDSLVIKRFFNLDHQTYQAGVLNEKTKELIGLSSSMVLRCDDCVKYHIGQAIASGATEQEIIETLEIALVIGGSIIIPHLRRAYEYLDAILGKASNLHADNP